MDVFRRVEEITALPDLKPQEEELLVKAEAGEGLLLGDGTLPNPGDDTRSIRAGIIRYLLLGGCDGLRCHERGVQIMGAWVPDKLDMKGCDSDSALQIRNSRFSESPMFEGAELRGLFLPGSRCPGINADRLRLRQSLHLNDGFQAMGEVRFPGAEIDGDLSCTNGTFSNERGYALLADSAKVGGSVFLEGKFNAKGTVRLLGIEIGGDLTCTGGMFSNSDGITLSVDGARIGGDVHLNGTFNATGAVRLLGAEIGGNLSCIDGTFCDKGGYALSADGVTVNGAVFLNGRFNATGAVRLLGAEIGGNLACIGGTFHNEGGTAVDVTNGKIAGSLFWRGGVSAVGRVQLAGTSCALLNDDWSDWPDAVGSLSLDGFTYGTIGGHGSVDAETRLKWLAKNYVPNGFRPQPYQHLAKVLREMGHADDARKVMVKKEKLQRADRLARLEKRLDDLQPTARAPDDQHAAQTTRVERHQLKFELWWLPKWNLLLRRLVGYGYYPFYSFWAGLGSFLFAAALFSATWHSGAFAPNSPVVLISEEWETIATLPNPAVEWEAGPGRDYETYNSLAYAFDTVIPLIDLGQETAWSPSTSRGPVGWIAWWAKWIFKVAGWIITALGAAALTGIIRRD